MIRFAARRSLQSIAAWTCGLVVAAALGMLAGRVASPPAPARPGQAPRVSGNALPVAYPAHILDVVDGDTVSVRVQVWPGQEVLTHVRMRGIDTPELRAQCPEEEAGAAAARKRLADLLASGPVTVSAPAPDKYFGRVVADIVLADGRSAAAVLLGEGFARAYSGKARGSWCAVSG